MKERGFSSSVCSKDETGYLCKKILVVPCTSFLLSSFPDTSFLPSQQIGFTKRDRDVRDYK